MVGFALVGMLAFSPTDFDVDLGITLSLFADDIAHGLTSPNIWYNKLIYPLNMPIVKGGNIFFHKKILTFK